MKNRGRVPGVRGRGGRTVVLALFICCCAPALCAPFELYLLTGNVEQPVPAVHNLGSFYPNEVASARFRLRNTADTPATLYVLAADGTGFALSGAPSLPAALPARAAIDFTVTFSSAATGTFSASLRAEGISVILTATVLPRLTYSTGGQILGGEPVSFGSVEGGAGIVRQFDIENLSSVILTVPAISIQGSGFALIGDSPAGAVLQPRQTARFEVRFLAPAAGLHQGVLIIGDRSFALIGTSIDPPLPKPVLSIDLAQPLSARQGLVTVRLDAASRTSASGTVTLEFRPLQSGATDPAIAFASGGRTAAFAVSPGDTPSLTIPFQTGTTAGTLVFTASLGGATDQQSVTIPVAPVGVSSAVAVRSAGGIEVRIAGFDNTRTAGQLAFTFFDSTGAAISPGAIRADSTAEFSRFFETSDAGGTFLLRSVFPVTGDASRVVAFEAELVNSAGTARTARIAF